VVKSIDLTWFNGALLGPSGAIGALCYAITAVARQSADPASLLEGEELAVRVVLALADTVAEVSRDLSPNHGSGALATLETVAAICKFQAVKSALICHFMLVFFNAPVGGGVQDAGPFSHVAQVLVVSQSVVSEQMLLLESNVKSPHPSLAAHSAWQVQLELEMEEPREEPTQRSGRKQNSQSKK
jgi:hypothetical protein